VKRQVLKKRAEQTKAESDNEINWDEDDDLETVDEIPGDSWIFSSASEFRPLQLHSKGVPKVRYFGGFSNLKIFLFYWIAEGIHRTKFYSYVLDAVQEKLLNEYEAELKTKKPSHAKKDSNASDDWEKLSNESK